ncbi:MAG: SPFH domain-containing protein [Christensenellales bacterium]|jgi:membrane protease subunit (stomatin/prohibitin family)
MGLIKAAFGSAGGVLADQWREYFHCESMPADILVQKGVKRVSARSSNTKASENIITNGSVIAVNEGQFMMIVEQGAIVDFCAEAGEFVWDASTEPTMLYGGFGKGLKESFKQFGKRFTFGGDTGKDQRVYFFNTKEILGNKYGTPAPVPFRVVDKNIGLDIDIAIRCNGEFSYKLVDPLIFYKNVCGNVASEFARTAIDSQLRTELMTALQPAFAKISEMGIRYSALPHHTTEISDVLNEVLTEKWQNARGLAIASIGINSVTASEEDEQMIKDLQRSAVFRDPGMAAARLADAQASAMVGAANNPSSGPVMAFAGMNMAQNAGGMNTQALYEMQAQQAAAPPAAPAAESKTWVCACGAENEGKFCHECGKEQPRKAQGGWTCACGAENKGKFCHACGKPKPAGALQYQCDQCGWEPEDPQNPPKFCPECGDPFDSEDIKS